MEEVGQSLGSSPTRQLSQMAVEAGPSEPGASEEETLANSGKQGPPQGVPQGWHAEEAPEVPASDSSPP